MSNCTCALQSFDMSPLYVYFDREWIPTGDEQEKQGIRRCLAFIVENYGTEEYGFNLATEQLSKRSTDGTAGFLKEILDEEISHCENLDIAFTACYVLTLLYKKRVDHSGCQDALASLENLRKNYFRRFANYVLSHELKSRCYKRMEDRLNDALREDQTAIDLLARKGKQNIGLYVSFASTVCKMIDSNEELDAFDIDSAIKYIEAVIAVNSRYSKYYYLKALLVFHRSKWDKKQELLFDYHEAVSLLDTAKKCLDRQSQHYRSDMKHYNALLCRMELAVTEHANDLKQKIIASANRDMAVKLMPKANANGNYFFVSYSHADYKQVYCDLIELILRQQNGPCLFVYDNMPEFMAGKKWTTLVKNFITDPKCCGVIFYLSPDFILGKSTREEIGYTRDRFGASCEDYFSVNLTHSTPFKLLLETLQSKELQELETLHFNREGVLNYLSLFTDEAIYIKRDTDPASTVHIEELDHNIRAKSRGDYE